MIYHAYRDKELMLVIHISAARSLCSPRQASTISCQRQQASDSCRRFRVGMMGRASSRYQIQASQIWQLMLPLHCTRCLTTFVLSTATVTVLETQPAALNCPTNDTIINRTLCYAEGALRLPILSKYKDLGTVVEGKVEQVGAGRVYCGVYCSCVSDMRT